MDFVIITVPTIYLHNFHALRNTCATRGPMCVCAVWSLMKLNESHESVKVLRCLHFEMAYVQTMFERQFRVASVIMNLSSNVWCETFERRLWFRHSTNIDNVVIWHHHRFFTLIDFIVRMGAVIIYSWPYSIWQPINKCSFWPRATKQDTIVCHSEWLISTFGK